MNYGYLFMMRTERLCIYPVSREQMEAMIVSEQNGEFKKRIPKCWRAVCGTPINGTGMSSG